MGVSSPRNISDTPTVRPTIIWDRKTEKQNRFSLFGVEPHTRLWLLLLCSKASARTAKKTCFSHTALDCRHESSLHRTRIMTKLGGCTYASVSGESSLPCLEAVSGLCLEVSLGTWGPDPILYQLKNDLEMGQAPTSQARPHNPDHLRPSNLAATTLRLVDHILSKFWWLPVSCEARNRGSGEVLCAKSAFFLV